MELQRIAEQQSALAESDGEKSEEETGGSHTLTCHNPETHKAEVLEARAGIRMKDHVGRMVEESVGQQSAYQLYQSIGSP